MNNLLACSSSINCLSFFCISSLSADLVAAREKVENKMMKKEMLASVYLITLYKISLCLQSSSAFQVACLAFLLSLWTKDKKFEDNRKQFSAG